MNSICATYDYRLVGLSAAIAILASYVALDLSARVTTAKGSVRWGWVSGGAVAMGTGIWSMHYIGMLACQFPMPVFYHVPTVVISLLAAIFASLIALVVVSREDLSGWHVASGGVPMGLGVVAMHYVGMAAMRIPATRSYHVGLLTLSILIGIGVSSVALWIATLFSRGKKQWRFKLISSIVMGLAILSVHYIGMAAVSYVPSAILPDLSHARDLSELANISIVIVTAIILGSAIVTSTVDRWISEQADELVQLQKSLISQYDAVAKEAEQVRLLLNSTVEGIIGINQDGICTFCNRAALTMLGYEYDGELVGAPMHELIHHHHADGTQYTREECIYEQALRRGDGAHMDGDVFWRRNGTTLFVECWSTPIRTGVTITGAVLTFWDIGKRREAEKARNRSEQMFRLIAENSADLIAVVDRDGHRIYNNPTYEQILGYSPEELKKTIAFEQIHPTDREKVIKAAKTAVQTGVGQAIEYRMMHKDGHYVDLESHSGPIRGPEGEIEALVVSARDIGLRKHAAQAEKLSAIGQLAAGIAHEINTPVQFVSDNISFLRDAWTEINPVLEEIGQPQSAPDQTSEKEEEDQENHALETRSRMDWFRTEVPNALSQSLEGIKRISKIVGAMRQFSHPGSGKRESIDINEAMETTLTVASNQLKYLVDIRRDYQPDIPPTECMPYEVRQVFLNLIVNAAQAVSERQRQEPGLKGTLTIRTRKVEDSIRIEIADNGMGIPDQVRSRVFDPFFTTKEVGEGTGQGLTICYDIVVHKHGGKIWFETEVGKGTSFLVELPLAAQLKGVPA